MLFCLGPHMGVSTNGNSPKPHIKHCRRNPSNFAGTLRHKVRNEPTKRGTLLVTNPSPRDKPQWRPSMFWPIHPWLRVPTKTIYFTFLGCPPGLQGLDPASVTVHHGPSAAANMTIAMTLDYPLGIYPLVDVVSFRQWSGVIPLSIQAVVASSCCCNVNVLMLWPVYRLAVSQILVITNSNNTDVQNFTGNHWYLLSHWLVYHW